MPLVIDEMAGLFAYRKNMLALRARLQTGCSLRRRQFFGDSCFSDT
uniref:Uncharacterized protein n=1 Tax=Candidatus Kentrum sp. UNK TaxID=2126344 RepID=A0A451ADJ8_9GAMM|nr:MAG: hypothetical protein BECKUNK1418G_GA0071005_104118 [Candidatus Kentron sp. UNK]VFK68925.1 MAG: hypothetical protein BECKUNK1418H_GA0071006_100810 [Candidatus Kentron sp. UNK]